MAIFSREAPENWDNVSAGEDTTADTPVPQPLILPELCHPRRRTIGFGVRTCPRNKNVIWCVPIHHHDLDPTGALRGRLFTHFVVPLPTLSQRKWSDCPERLHNGGILNPILNPRQDLPTVSPTLIRARFISRSRAANTDN